MSFMLNKNNVNKIYYVALILIFCLGIFLRLKTYFYCKSFWYDEAALALNVLDRNILGLLKPLDYVQCAPFLFLCFSKIITYLFGTSEYALRLIPLLSGILSIGAFWYLLKEVLNKKISILAATFLFSINYWLIYFSTEFKQYSTEALVAILSIIFLSKLNIKTLTLKKCTIIGFLFFISLLFSMPQFIILGAFIIYLICKNKKDSIKQIFFILLPFLIFTIPYYLYYLAPSREAMLDCTYLWEKYYIFLNFSSIKHFIKEFYWLAFYPNHVWKFILILNIIGVILVFKERKNAGIMILTILFLALIFSSVIPLYPAATRLGTYLIPLLILFCIKPLDLLCFNRENLKKQAIFLNIAVIILFYSCFRLYGIKYLTGFNNKYIFLKGFAREFIETVKENKADDIKIITFSNTKIACEYYLKRLNIKSDILSVIDYSTLSDKNIYSKKDTVYWLYGHRYNIKTINDDISEWLKNKKNAEIIFKKEMKVFDAQSDFYLVKFN